jgi:hypothetical protein
VISLDVYLEVSLGSGLRIENKKVESVCRAVLPPSAGGIAACAKQFCRLRRAVKPRAPGGIAA